MASSTVQSSSNQLTSIWSSLYGQGFSSQNVAGVNTGEFFLVCNEGGNIQGEFRVGSGTVNGVGVAKDSHGNSYKILF
jgi:hypothetical protein